MPFALGVAFFVVAAIVIIVVARSEITSTPVLFGAVVVAAGLMSVYAIANCRDSSHIPVREGSCLGYVFPQAQWTDARDDQAIYDEQRNLDPGRAGAWLHTVVKREAKALRRSRQRLVGSEEFDADGQEARRLPTPEEQLAEGPECPSAPVFRTRSSGFAAMRSTFWGRTPPNRRAIRVSAAGLAIDVTQKSFPRRLSHTRRWSKPKSSTASHRGKVSPRTRALARSGLGVDTDSPPADTRP